MKTSVLKCQSRARHEVAHSLRKEHLAGCRKGRHSCTDMNSDAREIMSDKFAFAGMDAAADLQAEGAHGLA